MPNVAIVEYDRISVVSRWNDAVPPSGPPFSCSATFSWTPATGNGVPSRVSWSSVKPSVDRKQPLQLIVPTRPSPP